MQKDDLKKQTVNLGNIQEMLHPVPRSIAERVVRAADEPLPEGAKYCVFGPDYQLYGPVTIETLQEWAGNGSLARSSWVYDYQSDHWCRAVALTKVRELLPPTEDGMKEGSCAEMEPSQVRRIKVLSDMEDHEIEDLLPYLTRSEVPALQPVVRAGAEQHSMCMVLAGEAVAFQVIDGVPHGLGTINVGDSFCEQCLAKPSPGLYNVNARMNLTLMRLHYRDFERLRRDHVDLAIKFQSTALMQVAVRSSTTKGMKGKVVRPQAMRSG